MKILELASGDKVAMPGEQPATFVALVQPHPLFAPLVMVIWRLPEGHPAGEWSHDALNPWQEVGDVVSTPDQRQENLRRALLHRSQW